MNDFTSNNGILAVLKNSSYVVAFFLGLNIQAVAILTVFLLLDIVTGVLKSVVIYGGRAFSSRSLSHGVLSKLLLITVPFILVWAGKGAGIDFTEFANNSLKVFILAEAYSILGNIYAIRIKKEVREFDAISWILENIRTVLLRLATSTKDREAVKCKDK